MLSFLFPRLQTASVMQHPRIGDASCFALRYQLCSRFAHAGKIGTDCGYSTCQHLLDWRVVKAEQADVLAQVPFAQVHHSKQTGQVALAEGHVAMAQLYFFHVETPFNGYGILRLAIELVNAREQFVGDKLKAVVEHNMKRLVIL